MSHVQDEFQARIERDVARIMRHIVGSEMDASALDGEIVLTVKDGKLVEVRFANDERATFTMALESVVEETDESHPVAFNVQPPSKKRKGKATEEPKADA